MIGRAPAISETTPVGVMSRTWLTHGAVRREAPAAPWPSWGDLRVLLAPLALRLPRLTRRLIAAHTTLFLWTRGRLASRWFGAGVLVLETVGRRTGQPRAAPVVYLPDGENLVVVPANGGAHGPPAWWLNLQAAGLGVAVLGRERRQIRPFEAAGAERERLWQRFAAISPVDHYQRRTDRRIPVVVLAPAANRPSSPPAPVHEPNTPDQEPLEARPCQLSS
jgi:deazaflavin-dependent oxidoreductase (nitroreductase family)